MDGPHEGITAAEKGGYVDLQGIQGIDGPQTVDVPQQVVDGPIDGPQAVSPGRVYENQVDEHRCMLLRAPSLVIRACPSNI